MFLCYQCFCKKRSKSNVVLSHEGFSISLSESDDMWDRIPCDTEVRETCEVCGLHGLYVRDVTDKFLDPLSKVYVMIPRIPDPPVPLTPEVKEWVTKFVKGVV